MRHMDKQNLRKYSLNKNQMLNFSLALIIWQRNIQSQFTLESVLHYTILEQTNFNSRNHFT